ncbi:MAG: efflux RND transporter permease subunit [Chthonomonadales bacterium]
MRFVERYLRKPHLLLSLVLVAAFVGLIGYQRIPVNLFPDSERPQIAVVTVYPGAAAADVEAEVSRTIEKEVSTIELVRKVTSVSRDEVSSVNIEFEYEKGLEPAATDVANALSKISAQLPRSIQPPMIFKVSSATPAVLTLALQPKPGSPLTLDMVRELADNRIKEWLLQVPNVSNVEVFGGHQPVIRVDVDPERLDRYGLTAQNVQTALAAFNSNQPLGLVINSNSQYLLKRAGEFGTVEDARNIVVAHRSEGDVHLRDVARVTRGILEPQSSYHADGAPAIAINIERAPSGHALDTFNSVVAVLPQLERMFPSIAFSVPDNQGDLIKLSVGNMQDALRDAIVMTVLVIFLFLADIPLMLLAAVSIPFTYLITFAVMWLMGSEFNLTTLTAVIVAVGMLLDDAIVVLENIERHYKSLGKTPYDAAVGGTEEVMLAIFSGTYATVMVLLPIIFIGGYVQTVLQPFGLTLVIALLASYVVSVTVIPILAPVLLRFSHGRRPSFIERWVHQFDERAVGPLRDAYVRAVQVAVRRPWIFLPPALLALVVSLRQMPLIGRDLMSPMDTGIVKISMQMFANTSLAATDAAVAELERRIRSHPEVTSISTYIGSEPAVISFGSARTAQQCDMTVHLIDRFHRKKNIWQLENEFRQAGRSIPGIQYLDVFDYGATPLSTINAPVDVMISGPDLNELQRIGDDVTRRLVANVQGITSIRSSWRLDNKEIAFRIIPERAALYGVSPAAVAAQVQGAVRGLPSSVFRIPNEDGIYLWVQYPSAERAQASDLPNYRIQTPMGSVPLASFGTLTTRVSPALITRQGLQRTLDIKAYRARMPITHLQEQVERALEGLPLPAGYSISHEGEVKLMQESFARLILSLALGIALLYFSLVPAFKSWLHPLTILTAIPLGLIGAAWGMLIAGLHSSMPSMMGMILLAGIVVKNSILLIDFIEEARARGESLDDALVGSVRIRTRPILMTAVGTAVGMIPIALGWAIGLERLAGLAVVAIFGLLVSTVLTLIYVPIFYKLLDAGAAALRRAVQVPRQSQHPAP